ncbi:hypothetical protein AB0K40_18025 [Nonomuraea bangladeshensis]|uniref:Uncharacterized protein n=1 Tax=Nonomuraea bangladeshensis TaxID=404385 RepID=A0ABV3H4E5_9ACTN
MITLCIVSSAAACLAALAGHLANPARRRRRQRAQQLDAIRCLVAGRLAKRPELWIEFWYAHQLDSLDAAGGA